MCRGWKVKETMWRKNTQSIQFHNGSIRFLLFCRYLSTKLSSRNRNIGSFFATYNKYVRVNSIWLLIKFRHFVNSIYIYMLIALIKFSNKQERTIITRRSFFPRWDKVEEFSLIFIDCILGLLSIYMYIHVYTRTLHGPAWPFESPNHSPRWERNSGYNDALRKRVTLDR